MSQFVAIAENLEREFRLGDARYINIPAIVTGIAELLETYHRRIIDAPNDDEREDALYRLSEKICKILFIIDDAWYDMDMQPVDAEVAKFLAGAFCERWTTQ